jgi:hypothetical protein
MSRATAIVAALFMVWATGRAIDAEIASAHLVRLPDSPAKSLLENREASQQENLRHARYVARHGAGANRRWHRNAAVWIKRELAETRRALHPPVLAIPEPWYSIAVCESSLGTGRPQWHIATGNGFYGGLQFDYGTWHEAQRNLGVYWTEYAHQATPWQQVAAARTLPLTRWPICGAPYR